MQTVMLRKSKIESLRNQGDMIVGCFAGLGGGHKD